MKKNQSLTNNFIFQFLYQAVVMLLPLFLSPYLTRTLHESALGDYTFVNSCAYYFYLFANLGIAKHGQRIIAQNANDNMKLRKVFWSLFFLHGIISLVAIVAFWVFIIFFVKETPELYYIHFLYISFALFDVSWLYFGMESFRKVAIRNVFIKIVECILIIIFVKEPKDVLVYAIIVNGGLLLGALALLPDAIISVKPIKFTYKDVGQHIRPMFIFSISIIAVSLYTIFDKTLLGILSIKENVAFYDYSYKIIMVPITICSVIGTVMFPRACKLAKEGNRDEQRKYFKYSTTVATAISSLSIFGVIAVSRLFAIIYYGEDFEVCGKIMIWLSPMVYIASIGDIIRTQYLIPNAKDKEYIKCVIYNAVINIIVSVMLIPRIGILGAVIGTECAEIFGLLYQIKKCSDLISVREVFRPLLPCGLIGLFMFICLMIFDIVLPFDLTGLVIRILIGLTVFFVGVIIYIFRFNQELKQELLARIKRKDAHNEK